jgi:hypothetical protein
MITVNFTGPDAFIVAQSFLSTLYDCKRDESVKDYMEYRYTGTAVHGYDVTVYIVNYQPVETIN